MCEAWRDGDRIRLFTSPASARLSPCELPAADVAGLSSPRVCEGTETKPGSRGRGSCRPGSGKEVCADFWPVTGHTCFFNVTCRSLKYSRGGFGPCVPGDHRGSATLWFPAGETFNAQTGRLGPLHGRHMVSHLLMVPVRAQDSQPGARACFPGVGSPMFTFQHRFHLTSGTSVSADTP